MREIRLYGPIGNGFDMWSGVEMFGESWLVDELGKAGGEDVELLINSDGGSVFTAKTMMEELARYKGQITSIVTGLAASAASFLPMATDRVTIAPGAQMMIHDPWTVAMGNEREMLKAAELLAGVRENTVIPAYLERMSTSRDELRAMLDAETWLSADEAVELGLVDGLSRTETVAAYIRPGLFAKVPETLCMIAQNRTEWRHALEKERIAVRTAPVRRIAHAMAMGRASRRSRWEELTNTAEAGQ